MSADFAPSLGLAFDASVLYDGANAKPRSGALGYVVSDGATPRFECSRSVDAFVSNTALEYRASRSRRVGRPRVRPGRVPPRPR